MADQGLHEAGGYIIKSCSIISSDGTISEVSGSLTHLNIYEDIFTPYVTGDATFGDALDLLTTLTMHGNEYLYLVLDKPSLDKPLEKFFRIYKIADRIFKTQSLQNYTIHFCSEEVIVSSQRYTRKSYRGVGIDFMIKDILKNELSVSSNKLDNGIFTSTAANYDIIIPRMQPLEAALWLNTRAYNNNESLYFFFENRDGYNFTSYENLISAEPYANFTREPKVTKDPSENIQSVNYIKIVVDHDLLKGIRYGQYSSSVFTFDMLNRSYVRNDLSAQDFNENSFLNKYFPANMATNRFNETLFDNIESMQKLCITTDSDPNRNPIHPEKWLSKTAMKLAQLNSLKVVINVPSDYMLKVGQVIQLDIPKMIPQNQSYEENLYKSGKYLITSVHHGMSGQLSSTTLELLSDSFSGKLPEPVDTLGALQYAKHQ